MSRADRSVWWMIGAAVVAAATSAQAQSNIDAGKSPAQIFANTCNACHRSARELKPTSAGFLREHYTTSAQEAATMAAYVASVGSDPRAVQQRRPPTLGAGQGAAAPPTALLGRLRGCRAEPSRRGRKTTAGLKTIGVRTARPRCRTAGRRQRSGSRGCGQAAAPVGERGSGQDVGCRHCPVAGCRAASQSCSRLRGIA